MSMEKNNPKVSIIIPAYNVEKYIKKCIISVLRQTISDIEIIVVDDGSTDATAKIVDELACQDKRITVIHKKNGGVSAARNSGLDICRGEYIAFVDGDDYLASDYVEYMLSLVEKTKADFCLSKCCFTQKGEAQTKADRMETLTAEEATALLIAPGVIVGCWNKLYKRSLLEENGLRFSTDLFYGEGLSFITTASQLASRVGVGCRKVYYYRRNNPVSATTKFDIDKLYNGEKSLILIGETLKIKSPKIDTALNLHRCIFCLGALVRLLTYKAEKQYEEDYRRWKTTVNKGAWQFLFTKGTPMYRRLLLIGGSICPRLLMQMDKVRRRKIMDNSVE